MKTVFTTLPIYKALQDQCGERSITNGSNTGYSPVYTPKHRLPSFQWMDNGDGAATVDHIWLVSNTGETEITTTHFTGILPVLYASLAGDDYFIYNGDTLNRSLPEGNHYLKIIMDTGHTYFSEWFTVDCVYCNFANTFTGTGFTVTDMVVSATGGGALQANSTPERTVFLGQQISVIFNLLTSTGIKPSFSIVSTSLGVISNVAVSADGLNELTLTATAAADDCFIRISTSGAATFTTSEVLIYTQYACKFVTLSFTNCCNVGDILYEDDFIQTLWIHSDNIEQAYPYVEKGQENGEGKFIPTFRRQEKNCLIRTAILPQYLIEVLHRLKMHDVMTYIDQVGDAFAVESIDTEHEWLFDDRYFASATITISLGDAIVTSGCC
jgi:hypothetical protein